MTLTIVTTHQVGEKLEGCTLFNSQLSYTLEHSRGRVTQYSLKNLENTPLATFKMNLFFLDHCFVIQSTREVWDAIPAGKLVQIKNEHTETSSIMYFRNVVNILCSLPNVQWTKNEAALIRELIA